MSIKLETTETVTLKLLQEKVVEANNVLQAFAGLLSKKYELPKDGNFTFNSDFTQIVEVSAAPIPSATAVPADSVDTVQTNVVPLKGRRKRAVEPVAEPVAQ
jgi:hypothetical protein